MIGDARAIVRRAAMEAQPGMGEGAVLVNPTRNLFDAACLRAIDRVDGTHERGADSTAWRIPADRVTDFIAALLEELDDDWHVRSATDRGEDVFYVEHHAPAGITHLRFAESTVPGPPMKDLVCTHYY